MPTLQGTTQRLELNQSSRTPTFEQLSGGKLVFWQGLGSFVQCALFNDEPREATLVTDVSNIDSTHLVVRKNGPNGGILFTKEILAGNVNPALTYAQWLTEISEHFTFAVTSTDTTQVVPASGNLPIYFVVTITTVAGVDYIAGFGYGEIVAAGYVNNPVASTYLAGTTPIRGGKLITDLDLNGYRIVDTSFTAKKEAGYVSLTTNQLEGDVVFQYPKSIAAADLRFPYKYIKDPANPPQVIEVVIGDIATDGSGSPTGFHFFLSSQAPASSTLFWKVEPKDTTEPIIYPAPRYVVYDTFVQKPKIGRRTYYASGISGLVLDSNVDTGGGTNASGNTTALQGVLDTIGAAGGGLLILDGAMLTTGDLYIWDDTTILRPNKACGLYLANGSNHYIFRNKNFTGDAWPRWAGRVYNNNIHIIGGTDNANCDHQAFYVNNGPSLLTTPFLVGYFFAGVNDLILEDVTIKNAQFFALLGAYLGNHQNKFCTAEQDVFRVGHSNDGFHYWGPMTGTLKVIHPRGINISDDLVALSYAEAPGYTNETDLFDGGRAAGVDTFVQGVSTGLQGAGPVVIHGVNWIYQNITPDMGNFVIHDVSARFHPGLATAFALYCDGKFKRLLCHNWKIEYPPTMVNSDPTVRGIKLLPYSTNCVIDFTKWQVSGATDDTAQLISLGGNSCAHVLNISDFHATRQVGGSPAGQLLSLSGGSGDFPGFDLVTIRDSSITGFVDLIYNGRASNKVPYVNVSNNVLNGAKLFNTAVGGAPGSVFDGIEELDWSTGGVLIRTGTRLSNNLLTLTSGAFANVTSINLPKGQWDVYGSGTFVATSSGLAASALNIGTSVVSATPGDEDAYVFTQFPYTGGNYYGFVLPMKRYSLSAPGTIYLVVYAAWVTATMQVYGVIKARRAGE